MNHSTMNRNEIIVSAQEIRHSADGTLMADHKASAALALASTDSRISGQTQVTGESVAFIGGSR
jgi:hypothetical protein